MLNHVDDLFSTYAIIQSVFLAITVMFFYCFWIANDFGKLINTMFGTKVRFLLCLSHPMLLNISVYHHQWDSHGTFSESENPCLLSMLISEAALIAATLIYLVRFPESIFPGRFDIYFNSHQIMHVLKLCTCIFARYT